MISSLSEYEAAKSKFRDNGSLHAERLKKALLEYRRQHNIFEKGDWVVNIKTRAFGDFIKYTNTNKGHKHCFVDIGLCDVALFCVKNVRHATDEEIKAGERLEVNQ